VSRRLAARFASGAAPAGRGLTALRASVSPGTLVLAAATPFLFLHASFQPSVSVTLGGASATAYLSDFAVLTVVLAALAAVRRGRLSALRDGASLWIAAAALFVWIAVEVVYGHVHSHGYSLAEHGVSAAKFLEYGLLAPSVVVLVRRRADLTLLLWSLVLWSCAATFVGILQFFGVPAADPHPSLGHRQASFLSSSDFAALSGAALLVGIAALAVPRLRLGSRLGGVAATTGALGMVVAGSTASVLGLATAIGALAVVVLLGRDLSWRRLAAAGAIGGVVLAGTVTIRGSDLEAFARFLGGSPAKQVRATRVPTYAHRTLLAWMGWEIWKDHPLLGVGWEGSADPVVFEAYLPAMHRRFPGEPALAFPADAPDRHYGVQDAWIEALADLGVVGFALWLSAFASAAWLALRETLRSDAAGPLLGLLGVGLLVWLWAAQGFYAGIPLDALTFIVFGLAVSRVDDA
jgi:O-antigen ligase